MSDPTGSTAQQQPSPTELAYVAAEEARRRRLGLPPLPPGRGRPGGVLRTLLRWVTVLCVVGLVAAGGIAAWGYFTGQIGPLRGDDKAVARTLTLAGDTPTWASPAQLRCAAESVVRAKGSSGLIDADVVTRAGGSFSYTGEWPSAVATQWYTKLLHCADGVGASNWAGQVAGAWTLEDPECLAEVGRPAVAGILAVTDLRLTDEDVAAKNATTITALDSCYARTPEAPTGAATSGYRQVTLEVTAPVVTAGIASVDDGSAEPTSGQEPDVSYTLPVAKGGAEACVQATTKVTYAWGTVRTGEPAKLCGKAAAARMEWRTVKHTCPKSTPKCTYVAAYVDGLAADQRVTVTYKPSGDFACPGKKPTCTVKIKAGAQGRAQTDPILATGKHGKIRATAGSLKATYPT